MNFPTRITNPRLQSGATTADSTFPLPLGEGQGVGDFPLLTKEGLGEVVAIGLKPGCFLHRQPPAKAGG